MTALDQNAIAATARRPLSGADAAPDALRVRVEQAKHAFSTRATRPFLRRARTLRLITENHAPQAGEVVLARVTAVGRCGHLQSPACRRQALFVGDEVVISYGSCCTDDELLAVLPEDLGPCHLAAAGGVASRVVEQHASVSGDTELEPIGVLADAHGPITLARASTHRVISGITERTDRPGHRVPEIAVVGTSTSPDGPTALAELAHGLAASGLTVTAGRATGTAAGEDCALFLDAGARRVLDHTDFGCPSTVGVPHEEVRDLLLSMVDELAAGAEQPDAVLIEITGDPCQGETSRLLADRFVGAVTDHVVLAADLAHAGTAHELHIEMIRRSARDDR